MAGDETSLDVRLGANARCFLTTQASTKIYRNPAPSSLRPRACARELADGFAAGAGARPDPIFRRFDLRRSGRSFICNPAPDWFCLIGFVPAAPPARERWSFTRLQSRNEIFLDGERLLLDSLLLDQAHGPLDGAHRMGRFNCLALLV